MTYRDTPPSEPGWYYVRVWFGKLSPGAEERSGGSGDYLMELREETVDRNPGWYIAHDRYRCEMSEWDDWEVLRRIPSADEFAAMEECVKAARSYFTARTDRDPDHEYDIYALFGDIEESLAKLDAIRGAE